MAISDDFTSTLVHLAVGEIAELGVLPTLLARACVSSLGVDGASISLMNDDVRMPLGADSAMSSTAEQLQFTLGEGPCMEAYRSGRSGSFSAAEIANRWPTYAERLAAETAYRSCATFPLDLGDGLVGALDLYLTTDDAVPPSVMGDAETVAADITHALFVDMSDADSDRGPNWLRSRSMRGRANLWVAIGLFMPLTVRSVGEITALIRSYGFLHGQAIDDVTRALADHTLDPQTILDE
jgi:hypothetical protein